MMTDLDRDTREFLLHNGKERKKKIMHEFGIYSKAAGINLLGLQFLLKEKVFFGEKKRQHRLKRNSFRFPNKQQQLWLDDTK